jgi:hypothetical protein
MLETEENEVNKEDNQWVLVLVIFVFDDEQGLSRRLGGSSLSSFPSVDRFPLVFISPPAQHPLGRARQ